MELWFWQILQLGIILSVLGSVAVKNTDFVVWNSDGKFYPWQLPQ